LNPVAQDLKNSTAIARFCVLLGWSPEETTAFGQFVGLAEVVGADVFELFVDE
jgi:hypothetical protein